MKFLVIFVVFFLLHFDLSYLSEGWCKKRSRKVFQ